MTPAASFLVIPFFNEERRIDREALLALVEGGLQLLLVDDGSRDGTAALLEEICRASPHAMEAMFLERNRGKGEAVRLGLLESLARGARITGYADADFATPPRELLRLAGSLHPPEVEVVLGARVALLGHRIERHSSRHYVGRVFATLASFILAIPVYDTQCGAKFFLASEPLKRALATPFHSRWAFDVELLGRLLYPGPGEPALALETFLEVPLRHWRDVGESKLSLSSKIKAVLDLWKIHAALSRRRKASRRGLRRGGNGET